MLRFAVVALLFLVAFPFIVLSGMGLMKPAEGFCLEHGLASDGEAPTADEIAASYFVSPELAPSARWWNDAFSWPVCMRSRRGEHRALANSNDRSLERLGAPKLTRLHVDEPDARVLRVLTSPSFSRDPIVIELRDGILAASWLVDDNPTPDANADYNAWRNAPLPVARAQAEITKADEEHFWELARRSEHRAHWNLATLDGNWLVLEMIAGGRRDVRLVLIGEAESDLFCGLASRVGVPDRALSIGDVPCGLAPRHVRVVMQSAE